MSYEKLSSIHAPSYQQALKAAEGSKSMPKYVFPGNAPSKAEQERIMAMQGGSGVKRYFRKAAEQQWEDPTLAEWDPSMYINICYCYNF